MSRNSSKRGIIVSYETFRQWCRKFGPEYARKLKRRQGRLGDIWYLDEVFVKIRGERHYLWRPWTKTGMSSASWFSDIATPARSNGSFASY